MSGVLSIAFNQDPAPCTANTDLSIFRGWHVYAAAGLRRHGFLSMAISLTNCKEIMVEAIDGVPLLRIPVDIGRSDVMRRINSIIKDLGYDMELDKISISYGELIRDLVLSMDKPILYLNGYRRRQEAWVVLRQLRSLLHGDVSVIMQNHASPPPRALGRGNVIRRAILYSRENELRKFRAYFFALTEAESRYLSASGIERVKVRPMAVDFDKLKPLNEANRVEMRRKLGLDEDSIYIISYGGGPEKGVHYSPLIQRSLARKFKRVKLIVTGIPNSLINIADWLRDHGVMAFPRSRLSHEDYLRLVSSSDAFIMPARSEMMYGGITVSVMEALALGVPVISPTLMHFPNHEMIGKLGAWTKYVNDRADLDKFIDSIIYVLENRTNFNPWEIHELGRRYYSWEAFASDFKDAVADLGD